MARVMSRVVSNEDSRCGNHKSLWRVKLSNCQIDATVNVTVEPTTHLMFDCLQEEPQGAWCRNWVYPEIRDLFRQSADFPL